MSKTMCVIHSFHSCIVYINMKRVLHMQTMHSALHIALLIQREDIALLLVRKGADINMKNKVRTLTSSWR